ncbi:MAG: 30S ribosomal protein S8e [Candidatus Aenigmarchaeota archaeon]|nr:30S ribosomal protein S8e [Candidatus Aenigmarchaeota archaeon]
MSIWHRDRGRKVTGGMIKLARKKKKYELGRLPTYTKFGKEVVKFVRTKGGKKKIRALSVEFANVLDPKAKTIKKVKILSVVENPDNPQLTRRGIITKGTTIRTELGLVKVTSRPSQCGVVSGILIEK